MYDLFQISLDDEFGSIMRENVKVGYEGECEGGL